MVKLLSDEQSEFQRKLHRAYATSRDELVLFNEAVDQDSDFEIKISSEDRDAMKEARRALQAKLDIE